MDTEQTKVEAVIVRDPQGKVVYQRSAGPLTSLAVQGRKIKRIGLWGEETFIPSDEHSVEIRQTNYFVPILIFILALLICGICSSGYL